MGLELTFNFDDLTIGDLEELLRAAGNNDLPKFVEIADRATVGGVRHMPLKLLHAALEQFSTSFAAYMRQLTDNSPAVLWMIRQALDSDKE